MTALASPCSTGHGEVHPSLSLPASGPTASIAAGALAAFIWAIYFVFAKTGTAAGLLPQDFALLRFGPAALVLLPWLIRHDPSRLAGIGWPRALTLTVLAGPPFILLSSAGYLYAPLSNGAVIQPSTVTLTSMAAAAVLLRERITPAKVIGIALILAGLAVIASNKNHAGGSMVWLGNLLFFGAGLSWSAYTILFKRWNLDAVAATAVVALLSTLLALPILLLSGGFARLAALPLQTLMSQIMVQGVLSGVVALIAFGMAVRQLGAARASLFPAVVPVAAMVISVPLTGTVPAAMEIAGALLATVGLLAAMGLLRLPTLVSRPQPSSKGMRS